MVISFVKGLKTLQEFQTSPFTNLLGLPISLLTSLHSTRRNLRVYQQKKVTNNGILPQSGTKSFIFFFTIPVLHLTLQLPYGIHM